MVLFFSSCLDIRYVIQVLDYGSNTATNTQRVGPTCAGQDEMVDASMGVQP